MAGITLKNKSILMENEQDAALHPNGLLTHSDPTPFLFESKYCTYHKNGVIR